MRMRDIRIVSYANDAALIADNEDDLQRLLISIMLITNTYCLDNIHNKNRAINKPL